MSSPLVIKKFAQPDERRPFLAHGHLDLLHLGDSDIGMAVFEPGWKWSRDVQPIAGTRSCQVAHSCYIVSGRLGLLMDDGTQALLTAGDVAYIPPGHDAWVVGDETCLMVDFEGLAGYARGEAQPATPAMH